MNIRLADVCFSWPGAEEPLFNRCSLDFASGTTTAILGPNGAGKTTLLELILGWRSPSAGHVLIDDADVSRMASDLRGRTMALVPQDERIPFAYSVLEYIMLGRAPHLPPLSPPGEEDRALGMDVLDRIGISELASRPVMRLSGGEQRLVLIARALVQQPRVLLLDEPANHLDPANRERVLEILRSLHDDGITLVLSSHEPDIVSRLAGNLVMVRKGRTPEAGIVDDMLVPERLEEIYGISVKMAEVEGRRLILWGK